MEIKDAGEKGDRCSAEKVQEEDRERKVGKGRVDVMEKRLGDVEKHEREKRR